MAKETIVLAVLTGSDWHDAGVDHVIIPRGFDVEGANAEYGKWYTKTYCPELRAGRRPKYLTFAEWLVQKCGCSFATDEDVIRYGD